MKRVLALILSAALIISAVAPVYGDDGQAAAAAAVNGEETPAAEDTGEPAVPSVADGPVSEMTDPVPEITDPAGEVTDPPSEGSGEESSDPEAGDRTDHEVTVEIPEADDAEGLPDEETSEGDELPGESETEEEAADELLGEETDDEPLLSDAEPVSVEPGLYTIASAADPNLILDVKGASLKRGARIQLYRNTGHTSQLFHISTGEDGYLTLKAFSSGLSLRARDGKIADNSVVEQNKNDGAAAMKWQLIPTGDEDGSFYIKCSDTDYCLDITDGKIASKTPLRLLKKTEGASQKFVLTRTEAAGSWDYVYGMFRYALGTGFLKNQEVDGLYVGSDGSPFAPIKDGVYVLHAADADDRVLDVVDNSSKDKTNIEITKSYKGPSQRFKLTAKGNGYYTITNASTGKALDVNKGIKKAGQNVQLYKANGTDAQLWRAMMAGPNGQYVKFVSKGSSLCLSRRDHGTAKKTNVELNYRTAEADAWRLVKSVKCDKLSYGRVTYQIVSAADTGRVIDILGAATGNGAAAQIYKKNATAAQHFRLHKAGSCVRIQAEHSARYLNVKGGKKTAGTPIIQFMHDGSANSKFKLVRASETTNDYYLQLGDTDYVIGLRGGSTAKKTKLELQKKNGSKTQMFRFVRSNSTRGRNTAAVRAEEILNRIGWSRRPAFDYGKVPYETFANNEANGLDWNANYGYVNRRGNCFIRAAQFCMMARVMGEEAYLIKGYVPSRTGNIRHGWVEIETKNGPRVFDVSYNSYGYANTYDVSYGQKGTYQYHIIGRIE